MRFELVEPPKIIWRTTKFKISMERGHGWSDTGWVNGEIRFFLFWCNKEQVVKLEDVKTGQIARIESGAQLPGLLLAKKWLKECF